MSQTLETAPPPVERTAEPPRKSLLTILLERPEIGALVAAVAIFIFFFAVAPPFRSLAAFSTVLYDSSTIGISRGSGIAEVPSGEVHEHVLQRRAVRREERQRDMEGIGNIVLGLAHLGRGHVAQALR